MDSGKLIAKHSELWINQTSYQQCEFIVKGYANLELEDAKIASNLGMWLDFSGHSETTLSNATLDFGAWSDIHFRDYSKANIQNLTSFGTSGLAFQRQCDITIEDSVIGTLGFGDSGNCNVRLYNSNITTIGITFDRDSSLKVADVRSGFYDHLDLKEKISFISGAQFDLIFNNSRVDSWQLEFYYDSETTVQNSTLNRLGIAVQGISAYVQDLNPQHYEYEQIGKIRLNNTSVRGDIVIRALDNSEVTVVNATVTLAATSNSKLHAINSTISEHVYYFFGISDSGGTTSAQAMGCFSSSFYLYGDISFPGSNIIYAWYYCNVTRNYVVRVRNMTGNFLPNADLRLMSRDGTPVWNGTTDSLGQADFNLTFSDSNYTGTLSLKTAKGGSYNTSQQVSFLSDTPIVVNLIEKPLGDINEDHVVNILDIAIVAKAFGSKPGDPDWNALGDLNKDGVINILDISLVAKDYGKTV
jgi:hypothetical protein